MPVASTNQIAPFTPQSLPNCVVWFDAFDTSSYNASSFSTWRNKGYAGGSSSGTSGTITSTTINSRPALSFGSSAYTISPSTIYTQTTRTVFTVTDGITSGVSIVTTPAAETIPVQLYISANKLTLGFYGAVVMVTTADVTTALGSPAICCETNTNATSPSDATQGIYINGTSYALSTSATASFGTGTTTSQYIGYTGNTSFKFGEVLIFDGALTDTERQQVEGYLANKWGMQTQLPVTHPYYSSLSTVLYRPVIRTFQPVDIPGCAMWLDAADSSTITTSSGNVTAWRDKSGNGNNTTSVVGTPTVSTQSGKQYVYVNGSSGFRGAVSITGTQLTTFAIIIFETLQNGSNRVISLGVTNDLDWQNTLYTAALYVNSQTLRTFRSGTGEINISTTASSIPRIASSLYDNTNAYLYLDGVVASPLASTGSFGIQAYGIGVNATSDGNEFFLGYIGEILVYNTAVTNSQRVQIEQYLAQKWGIPSSLPSTHPGKSLRAFSTVFTPKSLGDLNLWLDAADSSTITLNSGSVTAWADKSGTGYSASVFTGDNSGVLSTTNGRTSIYGSTYPFRMYVPSFAWNNAFTQFIVAKGLYSIGTNLAQDPLNGGEWNKYLLTGNWSLFSLPGLYGTDTRYVRGPEDPFPGQPDLLPGAINMWAIFCIGSNLGATLSHYTLDGSSGLSFLSYGGGGVSAGSETGNFIINGLSTYGLSTPTNLGEIVHYNRSLSVNERQQVEGYLAWKWGIQYKLPSTHPYIKSSP